MLDDALRLGLLFKTWPLSQSIDTLSAAETEMILSRMPEIMPAPTPPAPLHGDMFGE